MGECGLESCGPGEAPLVGSFEHGKKPYRSIKGRKFRDQLPDPRWIVLQGVRLRSGLLKIVWKMVFWWMHKQLTFSICLVYPSQRWKHSLLPWNSKQTWLRACNNPITEQSTMSLLQHNSCSWYHASDETAYISRAQNADYQVNIHQSSIHFCNNSSVDVPNQIEHENWPFKIFYVRTGLLKYFM